jgi:hypothetical protein
MNFTSADGEIDLIQGLYSGIPLTHLPQIENILVHTMSLFAQGCCLLVTTLCVDHAGLDAPRRMDAERPGWRSHAERRNENVFLWQYDKRA